eukprot:4930058-Amphidinium_carterae.1
MQRRKHEPSTLALWSLVMWHGQDIGGDRCRQCQQRCSCLAPCISGKMTRSLGCTTPDVRPQNPLEQSTHDCPYSVIKASFHPGIDNLYGSRLASMVLMQIKYLLSIPYGLATQLYKFGCTQRLCQSETPDAAMHNATGNKYKLQGVVHQSNCRNQANTDSEMPTVTELTCLQPNSLALHGDGCR